jgi:hypothetical protein
MLHADQFSRVLDLIASNEKLLKQLDQHLRELCTGQVSNETGALIIKSFFEYTHDDHFGDPAETGYRPMSGTVVGFRSTG